MNLTPGPVVYLSNLENYNHSITYINYKFGDWPAKMSLTKSGEISIKRREMLDWLISNLGESGYSLGLRKRGES